MKRRRTVNGKFQELDPSIAVKDQIRVQDVLQVTWGGAPVKQSFSKEKVRKSFVEKNRKSTRSSYDDLELADKRAEAKGSKKSTKEVAKSPDESVGARRVRAAAGPLDIKIQGSKYRVTGQVRRAKINDAGQYYTRSNLALKLREIEDGLGVKIKEPWPRRVAKEALYVATHHKDTFWSAVKLGRGSYETGVNDALLEYELEIHDGCIIDEAKCKKAKPHPAVTTLRRSNRIQQCIITKAQKNKKSKKKNIKK